MITRRYVIDVNSIDEFENLLTGSKLCKKLAQGGMKSIDQFKWLLQDIYYALYLDEPKMFPVTQTSTGARFNRLVLEQLMKTNEFKKSRKYTKANNLSSGIFAAYFAEAILAGLDEPIADLVNEIFCCEEELDFALTHKKAVDAVIAVAEQDRNIKSAEAYKALSEQWQHVVEKETLQLKTLSARLRVAWNKTSRKNVAAAGEEEKDGRERKFETGAEGLGDNKGVWTRGDLTPHLKLVEEYYDSPKLKRLVQRIGRLKEVKEIRFATDHKEDTAEVQGITYGNDLPMVVPEEWADYFNQARKAGFKKKFIDESLCLYDTKGKEGKGKGSLIICLDNSGSMQGPKEETSKAIAVAMLEIAMIQKRDFVVIMFGGPDDELKIFEIEKGLCTFEQLVEIGEYFLCSSGTDFEKPLREALKFLEKDKYPGGDIVFITDGVCSVSPEFLEIYHLQKKMREFKAISVMVNYGQVSTASLEAFSDMLFHSKDLKGLDVAGELFGKIRGE